MNEKKTSLDEVLGKAIRDEGFREQLLADPRAAVAGTGLSDEDLSLLVGGVKSEAASKFFDEISSAKRMFTCTSKGCAQYP